MEDFKPPKIDLSKYPFPLQAFIGGSFVDSAVDDRHTLQSSVNDATITQDLQWSRKQDVELAVQAAQQGLREWQALSREQRRDALIKLGMLIREHRARLHWLEAVLTGKDHRFSNFEIDAAADHFIHYGNMVDRFNTEVLQSSNNSLRYTIRQSWGPCAGICPFNGPLITFAMKVAPALACGNSIIIKTSEKNPFSTLFAASLANEAGIPPGALSCLTGGAEVGEALASHPAIRKISFTGSVKVGKLVHIAAAKSNLKSVTTELGGKSPIIVFPDADLEKALSDATMFLMMNGQGCALGTRLYLHHSIANRFVEKLVARIQEHCAGLGGHPLSPHTHSSPLYHHEQKYSVSKSLEVGKKQATLLCGGKFLGATGCYVEPAIFANATRDAVIVRDELFGPILVVAQFSTEEEVLSLANNTEFGLASYVWTGDVGRALRFSRLLESGSVSINGAGFISPDVPMGGWKQSGNGIENGKDAMMDWTQSKSISLSG